MNWILNIFKRKKQLHPSITNNQFFISYARTDLEMVKKIQADLQKQGANIWIDALNIQDGADWQIEIEKAIKNCPYFIVILSNKAAQSPQVQDEIYLAKKHRKIILPIMLEECIIPLQMIRLGIDFTGDYESGLNKILKYVNKND